MSAEMPPHIAAATDQDRAELRSLVELARQHVEMFACAFPGTCTGPFVPALVMEKPCTARDQLLLLAVAELAAAGWGLPVHLTDAALAALELPEGGNDDDHR